MTNYLSKPVLPLEFTILGSFSGYNQLAKGSVWQVLSERKAQEQHYIEMQIRRLRLAQIEDYPVKVTVTVHQRDKRMDADNVKAGATKLLLDAMQAAGLIKNDSQGYIGDVMYGPLATSKHNPRIEVRIEKYK